MQADALQRQNKSILLLAEPIASKDNQLFHIKSSIELCKFAL